MREDNVGFVSVDCSPLELRATYEMGKQEAVASRNLSPLRPCLGMTQNRGCWNAGMSQPSAPRRSRALHQRCFER